MNLLAVNKKKFFFIILFIPLIILVTSLVNRYVPTDIPDPDPQRELDSFHVAEGFEVTLFAAEPMVVKPIQMNWDADGRLWVVTSTAYPQMKTGEEANDKIYVLEDTDGDGKADKSTIFAENLQTPTGILPGDGGVYVANSTEILHLTDTDGDGKADKKRKVLTGFGTGDTHHLIHTFRWAPDGLLYFNQSIYIYSSIETPSGLKRLDGGGVWKLNPKTLELDVYAKGLVNPWGLQFNRWGQSFLTDGAGNEGINYGFPGAAFKAALGAERIMRGLNPGQPKHSGLEVISGRHLPESWEGSVISNDFRANRINRFKLEEQGSGFVSKQAEDLLWTSDIAFRPVDISVGPDGAIYVADWYNPIIQHGEVDFYDPRRDQQHGRIWRISAKNRPLVKRPKLENAPVNELLESLKLPEDWTRAQAKQVLKTRGANQVLPSLKTWIDNLDKKDAGYEHNLLEALWVYQSLDVINEPLLLTLLNAGSHNARAAAVRVLQSWYTKINNVPALLTKAVADEHAAVRLEAVIALGKLKSAEAARTAMGALEFPMDDFLDYALWQTMRDLEPYWVARVKAEPSFFGNAKKTAFALKSVGNPDAITQLTQMYQQNQVPEDYQKDALAAIAKYGKASDLNILFDMAVKPGQNKNAAAQLSALENAAKQRSVQPDRDLNTITNLIKNEDEAIALSAIRLTGYWRMEKMSDQLTVLAKNGNRNVKKAALAALSSIDNNKAEKIFIDMAGPKNSAELRLLAATQLVFVNPSEGARVAVEVLRTIPEKEDASELFQAFITKKEAVGFFANELNTKKIPAGIAKAGRLLIQRQLPLNRHKEEDVKLLKQALENSGGTLPVEKMPQQLDAPEINSLAAIIKASADPELGEKIYRKTGCMSCHAIGGAGGLIGPDLSSLGTSSPVETIIRSILYPTLSIKEGYELQRLVKKDGSEIMGYLVSTGASDMIMRDMTGAEVVVPKSQMDVIEKIPGSLMPPGLTSGLSRDEFSNLVGFLSRLGESGKFRVPTARYIRHWDAASADPESAKKIRDGGVAQIVKGNSFPFQPAYSKVSGELPVSELPVVEAGPGKRFSFVKFKIEVLSKGNVHLLMNSASGITAWVDQNSLTLAENGAEVNLAPGIHQVTLVIDRNVKKDGPVSVQLADATASPAQTRVIM